MTVFCTMWFSVEASVLVVEFMVSGSTKGRDFKSGGNTS